MKTHETLVRISIACLASLWACGSPDEESTARGPDTVLSPPNEVDVSDDLGDPEPDPSVLPPARTVIAQPSRLGFYGDAEASDGMEPKVVIVRNDTMSAVLVGKAYIIDDESLAVGTGGAGYFSVELPPLDEPLLRGDELVLTVSFERATEQKAALLVIETSHQSYNRLVVNLAGKFFLW